jgi:hypothetical protein
MIFITLSRLIIVRFTLHLKGENCRAVKKHGSFRFVSPGRIKVGPLFVLMSNAYFIPATISLVILKIQNLSQDIA